MIFDSWTGVLTAFARVLTAHSFIFIVALTPRRDLPDSTKPRHREFAAQARATAELMVMVLTGKA